VLKSYFLTGSGTAAVSKALAQLADELPARAAELEVEPIVAGEMPAELSGRAHLNVPRYRMARAVGHVGKKCPYPAESSR